MINSSDEWYWENYDQWYENWEWFKDFEGIEWYDWVAVFERSSMPDYSDFRKFALFDAFELEHYGVQVGYYVSFSGYHYQEQSTLSVLV